LPHILQTPMNFSPILSTVHYGCFKYYIY
jgi:hypothetical protein